MDEIDEICNLEDLKNEGFINQNRKNPWPPYTTIYAKEKRREDRYYDVTTIAIKHNYIGEHRIIRKVKTISSKSIKNE